MQTNLSIIQASHNSSEGKFCLYFDIMLTTHILTNVFNYLWIIKHLFLLKNALISFIVRFKYDFSLLHICRKRYFANLTLYCEICVSFIISNRKQVQTSKKGQHEQNVTFKLKNCLNVISNFKEHSLIFPMSVLNRRVKSNSTSTQKQKFKFSRQNMDGKF